MTRQHRTRLAVTLLAVPLLFGALSACGSAEDPGDGVASVTPGSPAPQTSPGGAAAANRQERVLQFTKCLRDQGVDVQDPAADGGLPRVSRDTDPATRRAAVGACRKYAPGLMSGANLSAEERQRVLEFMTCLRDNGVQVSDPDPKTGLPQRRDFAKFRNPDETTKAALKACADKLPDGLGGQ